MPIPMVIKAEFMPMSTEKNSHKSFLKPKFERNGNCKDISLISDWLAFSNWHIAYLRVAHANSHLEEPNDTDEEFGIYLPHSTHSLLFTEPVLSLPFWFAVSTASLSFFVMLMALLNNRSGSTESNVYSVPVNVSPSVKASQYCGQWYNDFVRYFTTLAVKLKLLITFMSS